MYINISIRTQPRRRERQVVQDVVAVTHPGHRLATQLLRPEVLLLVFGWFWFGLLVDMDGWMVTWVGSVGGGDMYHTHRTRHTHTHTHTHTHPTHTLTDL